MRMPNCSLQGAVKGTVNLLKTIVLRIYIYKKTYQSFQVIAQTKLVSFTILAALILYNNLIIIPQAKIFFDKT